MTNETAVQQVSELVNIICKNLNLRKSFLKQGAVATYFDVNGEKRWAAEHAIVAVVEADSTLADAFDSLMQKFESHAETATDVYLRQVLVQDLGEKTFIQVNAAFYNPALV